MRPLFSPRSDCSRRYRDRLDLLTSHTVTTLRPLILPSRNRSRRWTGEYPLCPEASATVSQSPIVKYSRCLLSSILHRFAVPRNLFACECTALASYRMLIRIIPSVSVSNCFASWVCSGISSFAVCVRADSAPKLLKCQLCLWMGNSPACSMHSPILAFGWGRHGRVLANV